MTSVAPVSASGINFAAVSESATGEVIEAVAGKSIVVVSVFLSNTTAQSVTFSSASTAITGAMAMATLGSLSASSPAGLFATAPGEALNVTLSGSTLLAGSIAYYLT